MASSNATIYFDNVTAARDAQRALRERGIDSEIHTNSSDGQTSGTETFMDRVREFFGATPSSDGEHGSAAFLTVPDGNAESYDIAREYGGRIRGSQTGLASGVSQTTDEEQRLRLHEERLGVNKKQVAEGEFRAHVETITQHQEVDVPVMREAVYVERRPASDSTDTADLDEGDREIRIPVTHEEVRIEKRPVTTEEVIVGKRQVQETQTVGADVRKQRVQFDSDVDVDERNVTDRNND